MICARVPFWQGSSSTEKRILVQHDHLPVYFTKSLSKAGTKNYTQPLGHQKIFIRAFADSGSLSFQRYLPCQYRCGNLRLYVHDQISKNFHSFYL